MSRNRKRHGFRTQSAIAHDTAQNAEIDRTMSAIRSASGFDPIPECAPNFSLDRQIAQARREMGEARWAQLQREWVG